MGLWEKACGINSEGKLGTWDVGTVGSIKGTPQE